jgi:uncharacterized membrane protein YeiB
MKRIETLDVLRGFALLGIILIHIRQMIHMSMDISQAEELVEQDQLLKAGPI